MNALINDIIKVLQSGRYDLTQEKTTQAQIQKRMQEKAPAFGFIRHHQFDKTSIPDFFEPELGIAIEVKIKGSKIDIYKQCERYCKFEEVKMLILCTNKAMGFPKELNGKPCYYINIGKAWL